MKKIILFAIIILLSGNTFATEKLEQIKPNWKIHDKWIVRTWYDIVDFATSKGDTIKVGEAPCDVTFEVINTNYIGNTLCYELSVKYPPEATGFITRYKLFYKKDNYKLLQVVNYSKRDDGTVRNDKVYDYLRSSDTSHINSGIPFELPDFTQTTNIVRKTKENFHIQNIEKDFDDNKIVITFQDKYKGRDTKRKAIQEWQAGLPWFKKAQIIDNNGKIMKSSFLKRIK